MCARDATAALAVLSGIRVLGLTALSDLAVVGVSDSPAAALAQPPLTTVALHTDITARYIVDVITSLVRGGPPPPMPRSSGASIVDRSSV